MPSNPINGLFIVVFFIVVLLLAWFAFKNHEDQKVMDELIKFNQELIRKNRELEKMMETVGDYAFGETLKAMDAEEKCRQRQLTANRES